MQIDKIIKKKDKKNQLENKFSSNRISAEVPSI